MRVCLASYGNRLAALLETATDLRFYRIDGKAARSERNAPMPEGGIHFLASVLAVAGADLLICGGVSGCCRNLFRQTGVRIMPWIRGENDEVLRALLDGRLDTMAMPGCRGRRCRGTRMKEQKS